MAVIEPRRKSPNSKNSVKMAERCCSRLARDSGKGYLLILTYHYVRICDTKKETSPIPPFMSCTLSRCSWAILPVILIAGWGIVEHKSYDRAEDEVYGHAAAAAVGGGDSSLLGDHPVHGRIQDRFQRGGESVRLQRRAAGGWRARAHGGALRVQHLVCKQRRADRPVAEHLRAQLLYRGVSRRKLRCGHRSEGRPVGAE